MLSRDGRRNGGDVLTRSIERVLGRSCDERGARVVREPRRRLWKIRRLVHAVSCRDTRCLRDRASRVCDSRIPAGASPECTPSPLDRFRAYAPDVSRAPRPCRGEPADAPEQVRPARRRPQHVRRTRELGASLNRVKNLLRSVVSVEEDVSNLADGIPAPRSLMWCQGIDGNVNVRSSRVLGAQPRLELRALNLLHRANALCDAVRLV